MNPRDVHRWGALHVALHAAIDVGKSIVTAHKTSYVVPSVRKPLTWGMLVEGKVAVAQVGEARYVVWEGLMLSYLLLGRASEV